VDKLVKKNIGDVISCVSTVHALISVGCVAFILYNDEESKWWNYKFETYSYAAEFAVGITVGYLLWY
jgi:hypothetical protein